jgi:hypothetical protein
VLEVDQVELVVDEVELVTVGLGVGVWLGVGTADVDGELAGWLSPNVHEP